LKEKRPKTLSQAVPNKCSIQYHYPQEIPIEPTTFAAFGGGKHGSDSWS